jgi:hypothetical protein
MRVSERVLVHLSSARSRQSGTKNGANLGCSYRESEKGLAGTLLMMVIYGDGVGVVDVMPHTVAKISQKKRWAFLVPGKTDQYDAGRESVCKHKPDSVMNDEWAKKSQRRMNVIAIQT